MSEEIEEGLVYRLRKRAEIRRAISSRKSVQEGKRDRIADLLEEAAIEIQALEAEVTGLTDSKAWDAYYEEHRKVQALESRIYELTAALKRPRK